MPPDPRYLVYLVPMMVVAFILLGVAATWPNWQTGLEKNYNIVASWPGPLIVVILWLVGIILVWLLWLQPGRHLVRMRSR